MHGDNRLGSLSIHGGLFRSGKLQALRRAFQRTLDARDWNTPDLLMEEHTLEIQPQTWRDLFLPLVL